MAHADRLRDESAGSASARAGAESGVVFSFAFDEEGRRTADPARTAWTWTSYALADKHARRAIETDETIPEDVREGLLAAEDHNHFDHDDGWLHGEVPDIQHELYGEAGKGEMPALSRFRFAFNGTRLISARRQPLQSVDDVRRMVEAGKRAFPAPADVIEAVVAHFFDRIGREMVRIGHDLDDIEDRIVGERWHSERERLSAVRRRIVVMHRNLSSVSTLFRHVEQMHGDELDDEQSALVARLAHRALSLNSESEQVQARARLLQDEMMARIGEQSNRLLSALSIMTAVLLPSTVISGLFGMNTQGLPFSASPHGFWIVTVLSGAFVLAAFLIVRRVGGPR